MCLFFDPRHTLTLRAAISAGPGIVIDGFEPSDIFLALLDGCCPCCSAAGDMLAALEADLRFPCKYEKGQPKARAAGGKDNNY